MNSLEKEAVKVESNISAMRIAFFRIIKVIIFIAIVAILALLVFTYLGKTFDMMAVVALIGVLGTVAFGGKALQSFSESPVNQKITDLVNKVTGQSKDTDSNN